VASLEKHVQGRHVMHRYVERHPTKFQVSLLRDRSGLWCGQTIYEERGPVAWNNDYAVTFSFEVEMCRGYALMRHADVRVRMRADDDRAIFTGTQLEQPRVVLSVEFEPKWQVVFICDHRAFPSQCVPQAPTVAPWSGLEEAGGSPPSDRPRRRRRPRQLA
jgi:hypothetical protein